MEKIHLEKYTKPFLIKKNDHFKLKYNLLLNFSKIFKKINMNIFNNENIIFKTILFIELEEDKGKMIVGFRFTKNTINRAPKGILRIARFGNCFAPMYNYGYYGDIYFKHFIRKWKNITFFNKNRKEVIDILKIVLNNFLNKDVINYLIDYI